jgi:CHAT domain-containing protein
MGRAFSYAGIPAVITSLWKVRDAKVPEIMQGFYEALYNGKPASQALTEARRSFIRQSDKFNAHPSYWGAFISIGDTLPIKNEGYTKWFWAGGILVFLLTGVMIYRLS